MPTRSRQKATAGEGVVRRRERIEQLRQATEELLTSDGWQRWLRTRSQFHRYSLHNTLLIAQQRPEATHVAGFRKWLELGRCVRKGEEAIRIFAPARRRSGSSPPSATAAPTRCRLTNTTTKPHLVGFRLACVFDVAQTDPLPGVDPAPLEPPHASVDGDSHAHLLGPLERHAATLGFRVQYEPLDGSVGYCSVRNSLIAIDSRLPANAKVSTLVHELAYAHGIDYQAYWTRISDPQLVEPERRLARFRAHNRFLRRLQHLSCGSGLHVDARSCAFSVPAVSTG